MKLNHQVVLRTTIKVKKLIQMKPFFSLFSITLVSLFLEREILLKVKFRPEKR